jgi:succinoglycan biosynthesis protein ExoM
MADRVAIAIPTFKRPKSLARLLDAIARLKTDADIQVLVADNDAEAHQGFDFCVQLAATYRWPLKPVIEEARGIAQVRNRLVAEALKSDVQFIAMIDDDEWPDENWIAEFLHVQHIVRADAIQGSVLFAATASGSKPVPDIRHASGLVEMLEGTGNLLVRREVFETIAAPWFDPAFALTGGEDFDFFMRLKKAGCRFAWADRAKALGDVPPLRNELSWVMRRAYSNGNSDMRVILKHRPGLMSVTRESLKIVTALLLSLPLALILSLSPNHRREPLTRLCRAAGKLTAMAGRRYNEYAVVHGE